MADTMDPPLSPAGANGKKRTSNGQVKIQSDANFCGQQAGTSMTEPAPPAPQLQLQFSEFSVQDTTEPVRKKQKRDTHSDADANIAGTPQTHSTTPPTSVKEKHEKRPMLPDNAKITKRPLLRPAIPSPFSSSDSSKILYITTSSRYIPTIKRVRKLLNEISKRSKQSLAAHIGTKSRRRKPLVPSGRLAAADVEREIAEEVTKKAIKSVGQEEVYLKATGRAIPRALDIGVYFQGEDDCKVKVEMGSVKAIDDIDVIRSEQERKGCGGNNPKKGTRNEESKVDVPETRIRTLSTITVAVSLK